MNLKLIAIKLLLIIVFFSIQMGFGWIYSRRFLGERKLYLLIPLSIIIGISFYATLLNLLSYLIPITISFYLVLFILIILTLTIYWGLPKGADIAWDLDRKATRGLIISLTAILIAGLFIDLGIVIFYEEFCRAFIATIARGNFPIRYPWAPDFAAQYHYGSLLFGAAAHNVSGLETYWVLDFISLILTGAIFLMLFGLIKDQTSNTVAAFLATFLFFFAGWLNWVKLFSGLNYVPLPETPWLRIPDNSVWQYLAAFFVRLSHLPAGGEFFSLGELYGFMYQKNHMPSLFGLPIFFCLVYLLLKNYREGDRQAYSYVPWSITMLVLLFFLALVDESKFGLFLLALPLYFIIELIVFRNLNPRLLFFAGLVLVISLSMALFQGGYLPQFVFGGSEDYAQRTLLTISSLRLREKFGIPFSHSLIPIGAQGWVPEYVRYFGIYFLLAPIILYFVYREKIRVGVFLTLVGLIAFILPQIISFPLIERSLVRITHIYVLFFAVVLGLILGHLIKSAQGLMAKLTWIVALFIVIVSSIGTFLYIFRVVETRPVYYQETPKLDRDAGLWMRSNLPDKSRLLAEDYYLIPQLSGLFVPAMIPKYSLSEDYTRALDSLDLASMQKLKVKYVYLTKGWYDRLPESAKALLSDPTYFKEVFSLPSQQPRVDWRKIYQFYDKEPVQ